MQGGIIRPENEQGQSRGTDGDLQKYMRNKKPDRKDEADAQSDIETVGIPIPIVQGRDGYTKAAEDYQETQSQ
jgi:hypothetical protein